MQLSKCIQYSHYLANLNKPKLTSYSKMKDTFTIISDDMHCLLFLNKRKNHFRITTNFWKLDGTYAEIALVCLYSSQFLSFSATDKLGSYRFGWKRENGPLTPVKFHKHLPVEYTGTRGSKQCCISISNCRPMTVEWSEFCVCRNNICPSNIYR